MVVRFELKGSVAIVTINRPEARNALNAAVWRGLADAIERIEADPAIILGIITGAGGAYSAGADLKEMSQYLEAGKEIDVDDVWKTIRAKREKPLIAAVDGFALGGGCELALSCDLIVASTRSQFGLPEIKRGILAGGGGLTRLPRVLPLNVAMEYALAGDFLPAQRAHELGMVNLLTEPEKAVEGALALAARITPNAPLSIKVARGIVRGVPDHTDDENWDRLKVATDWIIETEDAKEGPKAFAEKRPPRWKGR
jgi:enoyl-CoA hydratase